MKITDIFKSMDEVRAYADSLKDSVSSEDYDFVLYLLGLQKNQAISEIVSLKGEELEIDRYIVPIILDLNIRGYDTLASCSGLQEEHKKSKFGVEAGYVSFRQEDGLLEKIRSSLIDKQIEVKTGDCFLQSAITITLKIKDNDDLLKEKWQMVWNVLKQIKKMDE